MKCQFSASDAHRARPRSNLRAHCLSAAIRSRAPPQEHVPRRGHMLLPPAYSRNSDKVESTPEPFLLQPTPMQLVLRQERPKKALKVAPAGFGVP
jgi:hypothetical protein